MQQIATSNINELQRTASISGNSVRQACNKRGRYVEAESLYRHALAIQEAVLGPDHPDVAASLNNQAGLYHAQGRHELALEYFRRASTIHRNRASRTGAERSVGSLSAQRNVRFVFLRHLQATIEYPVDDDSARGALTGEGFEIGQLANATSCRSSPPETGDQYGFLPRRSPVQRAR